jgi:hypothetical protein
MALSVKALLLKDQNWLRYKQYYGEYLREVEVKSIHQILSCKHYARGQSHFVCSNQSCPHEKRVKFTCKNRACSSCGRSATDAWIEEQKALLPPAPWQHATLTMPSALWPFFKVDRRLIGDITRIASKVLKKIAAQKGVNPGIFMAIHSFGRAMNWNVHIHASVTRGGLTTENQWKECYFKSKILMKMWRYQIITLLRKRHNEGMLIIPGEYAGEDLYALFDTQYKKHWIVHLAKPHKNPIKDIKYLGRYLKRPPIASARLAHYNGSEVLFNYLNHRTKQTNYKCLDIFDFITRFIQHIPPKGFRLIRYAGFLSNRSRGKLLPMVNKIFNNQRAPKRITWQSMVKRTLGLDPLECILCKGTLKFSGITIGLSANQLFQYHDLIAKMKPIKMPLG